MRVETVQIQTDNGPVIINKSDYDPKVHKLAGDNKLKPPPNKAKNKKG